MTTADATRITHQADRLIAAKRWRALLIPAAVLAYLAYVFVAFDVAGLAGRARWDNGALLLRDFWSYKTHVTRSHADGEVAVAIEGSRRMTYAPDQVPDWARGPILLPGGAQVRFDGPAVHVTAPDRPEMVITPGAEGVSLRPLDTALPPGVSASDTRIEIDLPQSRVSVTRNRTEIHRRFPGWELFFFDLDSRFWGQSPGELLGLALSDPAQIGAMARDIWTNKVWHHSDVVWAIFETLLMAFLGTMGGALVALPLAFLAARNFAPLMMLRQAARRLFDFLRGVDGLIWTVILSRAFGPGPLTGSLAMLLTDTGSFGKLFSETLENIDNRQIEGLRSTGAGPIQRARWGVLPQIAPVILSQVLYFLESNTRSATVIGAITGGGIGLLLTQAIITQQDWEHVTYYILLIVALVMAMDWLSGLIRRRLITGSSDAA